jgi:hypothetical protein
MNDDQRFAKHLSDSIADVWDVAQWLSSRGHSVTVNPTFIAPSHEEWEDYADGGDLFITQRVEVKRLSAEFTSAQDWPFKDKFIVCAKHAWDRAKPKPYAFIYLNKSKTHMAVVKGDTHKFWEVEQRTDKRYDSMTQSFYFCPLEKVVFTLFKRG